MGKVYAVVILLLLAAFAFSLMPKAPTQTGVAPADIIGSPSDPE